MTLAYLLACAAVAFFGFRRLTPMDHNTRFIARLAFWSLPTAAFAGICAVLFWGYVPQWPSVVMAAAIASVQFIASGTPALYARRKDRQRPDSRACHTAPEPID